MAVVTTLIAVAKDLAWAFLGKPVLMKAAFGLLEWAAGRTDNPLDDRIVAEAKARYYGSDRAK